MHRGICSLLALCLVTPPGVGQDPQVSLLPKGVTRETRASIEKALKFLAREQSKDGSWRSGGGYGHYPCAMSGLAGLALLASGSTPTRGPYAKNVRRVTRYLLSQQQPNGLIAAAAEESRSMYGHGFGLLFLSQVYGMEEDVQKQRRIKQACKRAITLIERSQSRDGGWLYTPDSGGDEGSVTVTQVQALRSCRNAGIHVPKKTIENAIRCIERSQSPDGGGLRPGVGSVESRRKERDELKDNNHLTQLKGQMNQDGPSTNSLESASSGSGVAGRTAVDREREFRRQLESLVRRDDIPEELKLGVREYFERIHENDAE